MNMHALRYELTNCNIRHGKTAGFVPTFLAAWRPLDTKPSVKRYLWRVLVFHLKPKNNKDVGK